MGHIHRERDSKQFQPTHTSADSLVGVGQSQTKTDHLRTIGIGGARDSRSRFLLLRSPPKSLPPDLER